MHSLDSISQQLYLKLSYTNLLGTAAHGEDVMVASALPLATTMR